MLRDHVDNIVYIPQVKLSDPDIAFPETLPEKYPPCHLPRENRAG
jgi:hypothetical protein